MLKTDRIRRKKRISAKIIGKVSLPRLSIYRSNKYIYAQVIDDLSGKTLAAAYGDKPEVVGEEVAKKAVQTKISKVVFDRSGFRYHGRVKALADAARKGGLIF